MPLRHRSSGRLKVDCRGLATTVGFQLVRNALFLVERAHASALYCRDVHEGIIAAVSTGLADLHVNILNVSQTLMEGYFTMIMQGEFDESKQTIEDIQAAMEPIGQAAQVEIRIQSEAIFEAMHTL